MTLKLDNFLLQKDNFESQSSQLDLKLDNNGEDK